MFTINKKIMIYNYYFPLKGQGLLGELSERDLRKKISMLILEHLVISESNEASKDYCGHVKKTQGTTEEVQY